MRPKYKVILTGIISVLLLVAFIIVVDLLIHDAQFIKFALTRKTSWSAVPSSRAQIQAYIAIIRKYKPRLVVDIGCGEGNVIKELKAGLGSDYRIEGIEINQTSAEHAKKLLPGNVIHNIDMQHYVPEAGISVCYILYEPLWNVNVPEAIEIYTKFIDTTLSVSSNVHFIYASGVKSHILDDQFFRKRNLQLYWTKRVGSLLLRRTIHHYSQSKVYVT